jgi:hypothetical protein
VLLDGLSDRCMSEEKHEKIIEHTFEYSSESAKLVGFIFERPMRFQEKSRHNYQNLSLGSLDRRKHITNVLRSLDYF